MKNPAPVFLGCVALGCLILPAHADDPKHALHFTVMRNTPTVDGVIGADEYPASHGVMFKMEENFVPYDRQFLSARPVRTYYAWDERNLYVAMTSDGKKLKTDERGRDGRMYLDDSVEIYVHAVSDAGKLYQFIFNAADCLYDGAGGDAKWNSVGVVSKSTVADGVWTIECAIPWENLGIGGCDRQSLYLNVCRTYVGSARAKGDARWMAERPREATSTSRGHYAEWGHYPGVSLSTNCCRYAVDGFGDPNSGSIRSGVKVTAHAAGEYKFDVVAHASQPPWYDHHAVKVLMPGETMESCHEDFVPSAATIYMQLFDGAGKRVISGCFPYRNPMPIAYVGRRTDPKTQTFYLITDNWIAKPGDYSVRLVLKDYETGTQTAQVWTVAASVAQGRAEQAFDVKDVKPGLYRYDYEFVGPDGKVIGSGYDFLGKPVGEGEWAGTALGDEDAVPAPWTEPVAEADAFSCWGRTYRFGGSGLLSSITSAGREILSAPVALELDGRPLAFDCRLVGTGRSFANYRLTAKDLPFDLVLDLRAEFDGYLRFDLAWGSAEKSAKIGALELKIPLKREFVRGYEDSRTLVGKLVLGPGKTGSWDYDPHRSPYFWIGDAQSGLMGGQDSLRGWHLKAKKRGYTLSVDAAVAMVTMRFVDTPFEVSSTRRLRFYLEATPARPRNVRVAALTDADIGSCYAETRGPFFDELRPGFLDENAALGYRRMQAAGKYVSYYNGIYVNSPAAPYWGWFGDQWNLTGDPTFSICEVPQKDQVRRDRCRWTKTCLNCRNFFDWKLHNIAWFLSEPKYEAKDLYFDMGFPDHCHNPVHGCVWKDDFGETLSDWDQEALRSFYKRIRLLQQKKHPDATILGHIQATRTPSDAYFDWLTMGEAYESRVAPQGDYYDVLTPGDMQVGFAMRSDHTICISPQIYRTTLVYARHRLAQYDPYKPEFDRAARHASAYFAIHNLNVKMIYTEINNGSQWFRPGRFIQSLGPKRMYSAYYHATCPVAVEPASERFLHAVHSGDGKCLLVLLNDTDETVTKTVCFSPNAVGVATTTGEDIFSGSAIDLSVGSAQITLPPRESRFFAFGAPAGEFAFIVSADHKNALYRAGETATFSVTVSNVWAKALAHAGVVEWALDNFGEVKFAAGTNDLSRTGPAFKVKGKLDADGFLRLRLKANGNKNCRDWSVGYDVEKIRQDEPRPADFDAYWHGEQNRLRQEVPIDVKMTRDEDLSSAATDGYRVSFATFGGKRVYGLLSVPKDKSKGLYPIEIGVPGAGPGSYRLAGLADRVRLTMNVHHFDAEKTQELQTAHMRRVNRELAKKYAMPNLDAYCGQIGIAESREDYHYHDVVLGIDRAIDWLVAWAKGEGLADGTRVGYGGSSQGGYFGLMLAYLNTNITRASVRVPAATGHFAFRQKRQNSWPSLLDVQTPSKRAVAAQNAAYFDGVNFAAGVKIPVRFIVGFSDVTCPPHDVYAAYNVCPSTDKAIYNGVGTGHNWGKDKATQQIGARHFAWILEK